MPTADARSRHEVIRFNNSHHLSPQSNVISPVWAYFGFETDKKVQPVNLDERLSGNNLTRENTQDGISPTDVLATAEAAHPPLHHLRPAATVGNP